MDAGAIVFVGKRLHYIADVDIIDGLFSITVFGNFSNQEPFGLYTDIFQL